jgi:hypothetical protein
LSHSAETNSSAKAGIAAVAHSTTAAAKRGLAKNRNMYGSERMSGEIRAKDEEDP